MPSSSSPGLMPINASTAAWRSRRISSGSESAKNHSVRVVWLATRLFQSSDIEPPTTFRCPRNFDTSWTCTSGSDLGGLFVLIRYNPGRTGAKLSKDVVLTAQDFGKFVGGAEHFGWCPRFHRR